jgi:hypothetical protein
MSLPDLVPIAVFGLIYRGPSFLGHPRLLSFDPPGRQTSPCFANT